MKYSHDEDAMNALMFMATGWQPGHDLFERDRERFLGYVTKQHADRGYPLQRMAPEQVIEQVKSIFGQAMALAYVLDKDNMGQQYISNGMHSSMLPAPVAGRVWDIYAPQHGQDVSSTIVSDDVQRCYAHRCSPTLHLPPSLHLHQVVCSVGASIHLHQVGCSRAVRPTVSIQLHQMGCRLSLRLRQIESLRPPLRAHPPSG